MGELQKELRLKSAFSSDFADRLVARTPSIAPRHVQQSAVDTVVPFYKAEDVRPSPDEPIEFLKLLDPVGRHNLVALDPGGRTPLEGRTFAAHAWAEMSAWIAARNGSKNLYYSVNEPAAGAPDNKLRKCDISAIRAAHVDVDPTSEDHPDMMVRRTHAEAERRRLKAVAAQIDARSVPPSVVLDSGGGIQALWLFPEKLDARTWQLDVEAQNLSLAVVWGGDKPAHDISRILRLPGTVNIPDAGKIAKGRTPRLASILHRRGGKHDLHQIATIYPPEFPSAHTDRSPEISRQMDELDLDAVEQVSGYEDLPPTLRSRFDGARADDASLDAFWQLGKPEGTDTTASSARFELARRLKALHFSINDFGALLGVWDHAVGAGQDPFAARNEHWKRREIARCWVNSPAALDVNDWFEEVDTSAEGAPLSATDLLKAPLISFADAVASALQQSAKPLVKGLLDQGALSVLYGESNAGKTFVAMDIAYHVATGLAWAERRTAHLGVLYVAAEGGHGVRRRAKALAYRYGDSASRAAKFQFWLAGVNLLRPDADVARLTAEVRALGDVGLIVVDTLSRALAGGDENASTDMGALVKNVDRLRHSTGAHVMLVHHSGKDRARGARGHSLLRAATDTEIEVADNAIVVTKQRDLDGSFRRGFVLEPVVLGTDADSDEITSCTIRLVHTDERPAVRPTAAEEEVLSALRKLHLATGSNAGFRPQQICEECGTGVKAEAVRTRLRTLEKKRLVEKSSGGLWLSKPDSLSGGFDPVSRYFDDRAG